MSDIFIRTLPKRIATKNRGIFYKEIQQIIIDEQGKKKTKIVDKVYMALLHSPCIIPSLKIVIQHKNQN